MPGRDIPPPCYSLTLRILMTSAPLLRRASLMLAALTLACGDSTGPQAKLTEDQVSDMLEAMSMVASYGDVPGTALGADPFGTVTTTANATVTVSQTVDCPNGGSASVNGTATDDPTAGTMSAQITQNFSGCRATSESGRLWTFDGDPNIVTSVSASYNETTGAFSLTATQVGGIRVASDVGSGSCQINLTLTMSGNQTSFTGSLNGSACGHNIQQSVTVTQ